MIEWMMQVFKLGRKVKRSRLRFKLTEFVNPMNVEVQRVTGTAA